MRKRARTYIGTSGWQYSHWRGSFYPQDLPQKDWLKFYAQHFKTVEVNSSFYRQTKAATFQKWQEEVPKNFVFAIKGNRFLTHIKRLKDCEEPLKIFFEALSPLRGRTSDEVRPPRGKDVILWQLSPRLKQDLPRLESFLKLLPGNFRHAFELRHQSWIGGSTWKILRKYNVAVVFQDWQEWPQIREMTADFVYLRFHGNRVLYSSEYTEEELKTWAGNIKKWLRQGQDVYAYFNNDALSYAVPNARRLQELVGK